MSQCACQRSDFVVRLPPVWCMELLALLSGVFSVMTLLGACHEREAIDNQAWPDQRRSGFPRARSAWAPRSLSRGSAGPWVTVDGFWDRRACGDGTGNSSASSSNPPQDASRNSTDPSSIRRVAPHALCGSLVFVPPPPPVVCATGAWWTFIKAPTAPSYGRKQHQRSPTLACRARLRSLLTPMGRRAVISPTEANGNSLRGRVL